MALTEQETHTRIARVAELARQGRLPVDEARAQIADLRAHLALLARIG
jgi:hypothetical protein